MLFALGVQHHVHLTASAHKCVLVLFILDLHNLLQVVLRSCLPSPLCKCIGKKGLARLFLVHTKLPEMTECPWWGILWSMTYLDAATADKLDHPDLVIDLGCVCSFCDQYVP